MFDLIIEWLYDSSGPHLSSTVTSKINYTQNTLFIEDIYLS